MNHKHFDRLLTRVVVIMAAVLIGIAVILAVRSIGQSAAMQWPTPRGARTFERMASFPRLYPLHAFTASAPDKALTDAGNRISIEAPLPPGPSSITILA